MTTYAQAASMVDVKTFGGAISTAVFDDRDQCFLAGQGENDVLRAEFWSYFPKGPND